MRSLTISASAREADAVLGGLSTLKPQAGSVRELKHPREQAGSVVLLRKTANVRLSRKQTGPALVLLERVVSGSAWAGTAAEMEGALHRAGKAIARHQLVTTQDAAC